jgi:hypothetical protein
MRADTMIHSRPVEYLADTTRTTGSQIKPDK